MTEREPVWEKIPHWYFVKLIDRMERNGHGYLVQLGVTGGDGEISLPNFKLIDPANPKKFRIFRGQTFDPWPDATLADFNPENVTDPMTAEEIRAHM